ncbi:MAG: GtrA family protein [Bacteroidota bacterium]|nr:GtrA family protein [Bacteroidota bacterium]
MILFKQIKKIINSIINWFYIPFKNIIPIETFRYGATGGFNMALDIFLYFVFYNYIFHKEIFDLGFIAISPHIAAFVFVFPITFTNGFLLAKYITFTNSILKSSVQLSRYILTVSGSILLNYILLKFLVEYIEIWATPAKIITTIIVVAYSYIAQRFFTFKTNTI